MLLKRYDMVFNEDISRVLELFPGVGSGFIFEAGLKASSSSWKSKDFSLCVNKKETNRLLAGWEAIGLNKMSRGSTAWEKVLSFCRLWGEAGSVLHRNISDVWFEFDYDQLNKSLPEPCFFFSTATLSADRRTTSNSGETCHRWLFAPALEILYGESLTERVKNTVRQCIRNLPAGDIGSAIFQVGMMLSRQECETLRLCSVMPVAEYIEYLKRIGWPGAFRYLEPLLPVLGNYVDAVFADIDAGETLEPGIGLECCFKVQRSGGFRLKRFLDFLVEMELCFSEWAEEIIAFAAVPDTPVKGLDTGKKFKHDVSHIKIRLDPGGYADAKVYLSLSPQD